MIATSPIADVIASIPEVVVDIADVGEFYHEAKLIEFDNYAITCDIDISDSGLTSFVSNITLYEGEDIIPLTDEDVEAVGKQIETKINVA